MPACMIRIWISHYSACPAARYISGSAVRSSQLLQLKHFIKSRGKEVFRIMFELDSLNSKLHFPIENKLQMFRGGFDSKSKGSCP